MKEQILHWLKSDRSFNTAVALYQKFGASLSLKAILNRQGETPYNGNLLTEELRKLAEIDPDELKHILSQPTQKIQVAEAMNLTDVVEEVEETEPETSEAMTEQTEEVVTESTESVTEPVDQDKKKASPSSSEKASGSGKNSRS
ncbi:MAG: hypothetical protein NTU44_04655 [Bacteroidetes bacterium]|nr:hypothetical protein [Bacteroidota bacterium]